MFTKGDASMVVAPDYDVARGIKYDSVVDLPNNPNIFVVFSDNHAYPGYVITYIRDQKSFVSSQKFLQQVFANQFNVLR